MANKGRVYSFEALKNNFNFLKINIEQNNIHNVEIFNNGIYSHNCELDFQYVEEFAGGGFTTTVGVSDHRSVYEKVKCFKLDDWVKTNNIQKIDFIKLDVEGAETYVLEGAKDVINNMRPDLLVEFNPYTMKTYFGISEEEFYQKTKTFISISLSCR